MVEINSRVLEVCSVLKLDLTDVRTIGIYGTCGIGKTTIARVVYDSISNQFEASSFLHYVIDTCGRPRLLYLQKKLLSDISMERNIRFENVDEGVQLIKRTLCNKKVLLVLDDVVDYVPGRIQLHSLVGERSWYGPGSRIIITTRDQHLLEAHAVDAMYRPEEISNDEALRLFSLTCFGSEHIPEGYKEMSNHVVGYARGLPLAIKFLGSHLVGRSILEWKTCLHELGKKIPTEILHVFRISFDSLHKTEKEIFLHIACFFNGEDRNRTEDILDYLELHPSIGLRVLMDKYLLDLSLDKNGLSMHPLVQEMGREIVCLESEEWPSRSRLWLPEEIDAVLTKNIVSNYVEIFNLNTDPFYY